jgi:Flp pilus assembly protein TadD
MDQRKALDATLATAGHQPGRFDTYLRVGQAAYAADSFSWAVANLRAAIALEPDNYDANWLLARSLYGSRQYTDAIATLEHVLQIKPGQRDPLWLMAWSHYMLKQYEQAIQWAEQALQLRPNDSDLHWLRANAALQLGDTGQAAQAAAAALESAATSEESQKLVQFFKNNLHDETMVDQAADISIGLARTVTDFVQLSDSFRKSGEPEWALLAARRGAEMYTDTSDPLQPMHCHFYRESATEPLTKLACRAYRAKDFVLAIKAISQAIALHPDDARLHFTLGAMQLAAGDKDAANLAYTTAIELADRLPGSDLRRARYNEALMNLRRIVDDPSEASTDFIQMLIEARDAR